MRIAEAFSWLVPDVLSPEGIVGLILPATSLFNLEARTYRKHFFAKHRVFRITNFSHLRKMLFPRNDYPAFTIVYQPTKDEEEQKPPLLHCAPFSINQIPGSHDRLWTLTIHEQDIQIVDASDADTGETFIWKLALWGSFQDKRAIERIEALFPSRLEDLCVSRKWSFSEGAQLRDQRYTPREELQAVDELKGKKMFQREAMRKSLFRFSVPQDVLRAIPDEMCHIRKRGGEAGLSLTQSPHMALSPGWGSFMTFSNDDFVIPPRVMGIAGPKEDASFLRALSLYLNSSLASYYLFFHAQEWGVFRQARYVSLTEVRKLPIPDFTLSQVEKLVDLHQQLVDAEKQTIAEAFATVKDGQMELFNGHQTRTSEAPTTPDLLAKLSPSQKNAVMKAISVFHASSQKAIDETIFALFNVPDDIRLLVTDFVQVRLSLDKPSVLKTVTRKPSEQELLDYARELRDELDSFAAGHAYHGITITSSPDLIECLIEMTSSDTPVVIDTNSIRSGDLTSSLVLSELSESLREQISQWAYVQRGLRLFDGPRIYLYKSPRLIDWTRTQAMNDAGDLIEEVLTSL
jgi:hypothetical protein